jgi:PIN domain nuclease of toxin-antitoxin system
VIPLLLDTCVIIRTAERAQFASAAREAMAQAAVDQTPLYVSPISAWELGLLEKKNRLATSGSARGLFAELLARPGVRLAALSVDVLFATSSLPDLDHKDPADRIIIATAREYGMRIVTSDRAMLRYADKGHVLAVEM